MTIDERLERLTERHEALTQTVEMLTADVRSFASDINRMRGVMDDVMVSIARLATIAQAHETRIDRLENKD